LRSLHVDSTRNAMQHDPNNAFGSFTENPLRTRERWESSRLSHAGRLMARQADIAIYHPSFSQQLLISTSRMRISNCGQVRKRIVNARIKLATAIVHMNISDVDQQTEQCNQQHWDSKFLGSRFRTFTQCFKARRGSGGSDATAYGRRRAVRQPFFSATLVTILAHFDGAGGAGAEALFVALVAAAAGGALVFAPGGRAIGASKSSTCARRLRRY